MKCSPRSPEASSKAVICRSLTGPLETSCIRATHGPKRYSTPYGRMLIAGPNGRRSSPARPRWRRIWSPRKRWCLRVSLRARPTSDSNCVRVIAGSSRTASGTKLARRPGMLRASAPTRLATGRVSSTSLAPVTRWV